MTKPLTQIIHWVYEVCIVMTSTLFIAAPFLYIFLGIHYLTMWVVALPFGALSMLLHELQSNPI